MTANKGEVTLKDIAKTVGKSVAAVSKALHDHEDISSETREIIRQVAHDMGYVPNITAQRLQKKRTDTIGLIVPTFSARQSDPFFTELLAGAADQAARQGFDLLVLTRTPGLEEETAYQRLVNQRRVDGVIVAQPRQEDWRINFLIGRQIPFVVVSHLGLNKAVPSVSINTLIGISQAVEHLISQGRRKLVLIPPPSNLCFADVCRQAFEAAVAEQSQATGQIAEEVATFAQEAGYRAGHILLAASKPPDGIIACHDLVAMGVMAAIHDQGFEIGSDIAVIGFGDILLSEWSHPPLTSIHQPTYSMGQRAARILIDLVIDQSSAECQVTMDPWLVVRQSSDLELWL
jgi:DNA-binding LacI/PurR family transcriptional regulator